MTVLRSGSATDVGRVRTVNQDMPLERPNLYAVADGMGGHVGGEVAARVAVETLERAFEHSPTIDGLLGAFTEANNAVWQESLLNADLRGMGTTLTAMALVGGTGGKDVLALANVGDSRAYVFSDGELSQVTADHSLAEERMRHGEMTEEEAAVHPQRHILTRALGVSSDVQADMWELELRSGDRVLLCSDGLTNEVSTEEMAEILREVDDPDEAARRLVDAANEHGGADNITVVIVDVQVGDDGDGTKARISPIGREAATIAVGTATASAAAATASGAGEAAAATAPSNGAGLPAGDATATLPAARPDDTLAPGSRLGFGDEPLTLAETGPRSDEFFLGTAPPVPVARATARVPPPVTPSAERGGEAPEKESRRARRRRLGIPRRVTFRVVGFVLLGRGRAGRGVLRAALVRLRQLDRHRPGPADRREAGAARRGALVPPQGGGPHDIHPERGPAGRGSGGARRRPGGLPGERSALRRPDRRRRDGRDLDDDHHLDRAVLDDDRAGRCELDHVDDDRGCSVSAAPNPRPRSRPA